MKNVKYNYLNRRITIDPDLCDGKPICGKRISVQTIVELISDGETNENILAHYPSLDEEDIQACLIFASKLMKHKYTLQALLPTGQVNCRLIYKMTPADH